MGDCKGYDMDVGTGLGRPGKLSHLAPARNEPLLMLTVGDLVERAAEEYGSLPGLIVPGKLELSFKGIKEKTMTIASGLAALGLVKGDIVVILSRYNSADYYYYLLQLACATLGLVCATCDEWKAEVLLEYLQTIEPACLLLGDEGEPDNSEYDLVTKIIPEIGSFQVNQNIRTSAVPKLRVVITISKTPKSGVFTFEEVELRGLARKEELSDILQIVQPEDICTLQPSSGTTTGKSKFSGRSHQTMVNNALALGREYRLSTKDKGILMKFTGMTTNHIIMPCLTFGCAVVLIMERNCEAKAVDAIISEKVTYLSGTPLVLEAIRKDVVQRGVRLESLRMVLVGGDQCSAGLASQIIRDYPVPVVRKIFGMSEVSTIFRSLRTDTNELINSTIGYPSPLIEVKLVDKLGRTVEVGSTGELCVRGFQVIPGPHNSTKLDDQNWFHTGDLMVMLESGHCRLVGRCQDVLVVGTTRISPVEMAAFFAEHPKVVQAYVFGIGLPIRVAVWIQLFDGAMMEKQEILDFCAQNLTTELIPSYIHFVQSLPRNRRGKLNKQLIREESIQIFGLD